MEILVNLKCWEPTRLERYTTAVMKDMILSQEARVIINAKTGEIMYYDGE